MKSYYGGPVGTHQRSFERYHPRPPIRPPFPKIGGSQPQPKTAIAIVSGTQIWPVHSQGPSEQKPVTKGRKGNVGVSRDCQFFSEPHIISGTGKDTNFKFGRYIHRVHPNKSPLKNLKKRERGRIQGLPKFFEYPYYLRKG